MLLSKSGLNLYLSCPQAFKFAYIDKLQPAKTNKYSKGVSLHEYFDMFFDNYYVDNGYVYPKFRVPERYHKAFSVFLKHENARYHKLSLLGKLDLFKPVSREEYFVNKNLGIHGVIDRIDMEPDDTFTLIEYKTGGLNLANVMRELAFYTLVLEPYTKVGMWKVIATGQGRVYEIPHDDHNVELVNRVKDLILRVKERIEKGIFPQNKNPDSCGWCDYKAYCKAWEVEL